MSPSELAIVVSRVAPRLSIELRLRVARFAVAVMHEDRDDRAERSARVSERAFEEEQMSHLPPIERARTLRSP